MMSISRVSAVVWMDSKRGCLPSALERVVESNSPRDNMINQESAKRQRHCAHIGSLDNQSDGKGKEAKRKSRALSQ